MNEIIKKLCNADGVSGFEFHAAEVALDLIKPYIDHGYIDQFGNVIAYKYSKKQNAKTIMLDAHIDQIGFLVTEITDEGFLRFTNVGGIDSRLLLGADVLVIGKEKVLNGVIATVSPHLMDRTGKATLIPEMLIDIGYSSKAKSEEYVKVGSRIIFGDDLCNLTPDTITGKSLDDRACVASIIHTFELLKDTDVDLNVVAVFSGCEEVGGPGASIATWAVRPDMAIAIDVTHAHTPDANPLQTVSIDDITVTRGPNLHKKMTNDLITVGKAYDIPVVVQVAERMTGTNARHIQVVREGVPVALIGLPLKYMHTQVETIKLSSVKAIGKLMYQYIRHYREV